MFVTYLINAVIGAFIGFITNYLAIKMLFKPDKPVYIGKLRIPFTPGIIPKEKVRLAQSIGSVVGEKLLTADVLEKALKDENINQSMDKFINETITGLEESDSSLRDILAPIAKDKEKINDDVCEALGRYLKTVVGSEEAKSVLKNLLNRLMAQWLATPIKDLDNQFHFSVDKGMDFLLRLIKEKDFLDKAELQAVRFIEKESGNTTPLSHYLPDTFFDSVKNTVSDNAGNIGSIVLGLLDNPGIEKNMIEILRGLLDASVTTRVINVFVSKEAMYKRIKLKIEKYLKSEKGKQELVQAVNQHVDKLKTTRVGEIVKHANREDIHQIIGSLIRLGAENCLNANFKEMLSSQLGKYISDHPDATVGTLLKPLAKGEIPYGKFIEDTVELIVRSHADKWVDEFLRFLVPWLLDRKVARMAALFKGYEKNIGSFLKLILFSFITPRLGAIIQSMNISKLIAEKVNEYDITELEEIILSIVDRELKVIILLGAIFGFIIGLAGPLISGLLK